MDLDSFKTIKSNFVQELIDAEAGRKTSLPFIVHQIPPFSLVNDGEKFQVVIVGGTFAINGLMQKNGKKADLLIKDKKDLPLLQNREDFLIFIENEIDVNTRVVALNFAYPIIPVFERGKLDGILLRGTKGHTFRGLIGKKIGEEIKKYTSGKKKHELQVSVANDTVCLLLSGLEEKIPWGRLGAGIVGTGMNFAFFLEKDKLVNLESADFSKFPQTPTGKEIDEESANPGKSRYEKEVAGVYLYKHFNKFLRKQNIPYPSLRNTEELDALARREDGKVTEFARMLFERSAALIACQIAAIMEFRETDMTFVMEGSMFWKGYKYQENVNAYLQKLTQHKATFVEIENSGIVGAAHLVI